MKPMNVAIISSSIDPIYYNALDKHLNKLMETSQCFLFNILCGYVEGRSDKSKETLGELWANKHGAPIIYISEKTKKGLVHQLFLKADYIIFLLDGNPNINNLFMQYKMLGKHGSCIKI